MYYYSIHLHNFIIYKALIKILAVGNMNIDAQMERYFGPKAVIPPDEGIPFKAGKGVSGLVKLSPGQYIHYRFSAVRYDLEAGAVLDLLASRFSGRMLYCLEGDGTIILNGERKTFAMEYFAHVGEGHHVALENSGTQTMQIFSFVFGASPEARPDLMRTKENSTVLDFDDGLRAIYGFLRLEEALTLQKGSWYISFLTQDRHSGKPSRAQAGSRSSWRHLPITFITMLS